MTGNSQALLLTAPEAAKALAISPRTLWSLTQRGDIPCVRIGRSVRYDLEDLRAWIASRKEALQTT
jgi:excisionase family DNA binding protein